MGLRNIRNENEEIMRKKSRDITKFDDRLHELLDDMAETMYDADGVGLAGVQVGVLRRCAVVDIGDGLIEMINPVIVESEGEQIGVEGCLSCPNKYGVTKRPNRVKVVALDRNGKDITIEGEGFLAKALCHEISHLDGQMFTDIAIYMMNDDELYNYSNMNKKQEENFIEKLVNDNYVEEK